MQYNKTEFTINDNQYLETSKCPGFYAVIKRDEIDLRNTSVKWKKRLDCIIGNTLLFACRAKLVKPPLGPKTLYTIKEAHLQAACQGSIGNIWKFDKD